MSYIYHLFSRIGWVWAVVFAVFLVIMMKKRPRSREDAKGAAKELQS